MKVSAVCRVLAFTVIVSLLILVMGFGISAQAAKLGLASAWLFEENGGKVVKDIIWIHDADYPVFMWHVKGEVGRIDGKTIVNVYRHIRVPKRNGENALCKCT